MDYDSAAMISQKLSTIEKNSGILMFDVQEILDDQDLGFPSVFAYHCVVFVIIADFQVCYWFYYLN